MIASFRCATNLIIPRPLTTHSISGLTLHTAKKFINLAIKMLYRLPEKKIPNKTGLANINNQEFSSSLAAIEQQTPETLKAVAHFALYQPNDQDNTHLASTIKFAV